MGVESSGSTRFRPEKEAVKPTWPLAKFPKTNSLPREFHHDTTCLGGIWNRYRERVRLDFDQDLIFTLDGFGSPQVLQRLLERRPDFADQNR